jgi:hypothetical protein
MRYVPVSVQYWPYNVIFAWQYLENSTLFSIGGGGEDRARSYTVLNIKKAPWQKKCPVFQRFLAVVYSIAFDV